MTNLNNRFVSNRVFRINVGFLLHGDAGTSRDFNYDLPQMRLTDDVVLSDLRGTVRLTRTARGILTQARMEAGTETECVRCLDRYNLRLDFEVEELFVYPPTPEAEWNVADDGVLDLAPLIRAEVIVHTPIGAVCRSDCRGLCPECGHNLNEGPCGCERDRVDPRLAILKDLRREN